MFEKGEILILNTKGVEPQRVEFMESEMFLGKEMNIVKLKNKVLCPCRNEDLKRINPMAEPIEVIVSESSVAVRFSDYDELEIVEIAPKKPVDIEKQVLLCSAQKFGFFQSDIEKFVDNAIKVKTEN